MSIHFREQAREELISSEELEEPVIRSQKGTIPALVGSFLLVLAAVLWLVFGRISVTAKGEGIYIKELDRIICFVSAEQAFELENGMKISAVTKGNHQENWSAVLEKTESLWQTEEERLEVFRGNRELLSKLEGESPSVLCYCRIIESGNMRKDGIFFDIEIVLDEVSPISLLWRKQDE